MTERVEENVQLYLRYSNSLAMLNKTELPLFTIAKKMACQINLYLGMPSFNKKVLQESAKSFKMAGISVWMFWLQDSLDDNLPADQNLK